METSIRKWLIRSNANTYNNITIQFYINPFVLNAPFLYPPENIKKGFLVFLGGRGKDALGKNGLTELLL